VTRAQRLETDPEKEPPDPRSPFERDRDRLLYTPHFRRLAAVTQVVGSHETELFHNRLTHTLKVAQIGRRIAQRVEGCSDFEIDADVVEAAALAHDIGHPPFGHIAEERLDELMVGQYSVPDGFEGNAQSFRIVTKLASRPSGQPGLNLTRASLQALTKYPWERGTQGKRHRKYGAYGTEHDEFVWSRNSVVLDEQTPEAMIMDWADDVAYAIHDLEDFCEARFIPIDRLARDEPTQVKFLARTRERWADQGRPMDDDEWREYERVAQVLFAEFPTELDGNQTVRQLSAAKVNLFASGLVAEDGHLKEDPDMRRQLDLLKSLTWTYVIESPGLATQQEGQRKLITKLLEYFMVATTRAPHSLPRWAVDQALAAATDAERKRLACDVVASLSEAQAVAVFGRVTGMRIGSIHEAIGA
jgi:dGTPase